MQRKFLAGPAVVALGTAAVMLLSAQRSASPCDVGKVAYLDGNAILASLPDYIKNDSLLKNQEDGYQTELEKLKADYDSSVAAYQAKSAVLIAGTKAIEEKKLDDKRNALQDRYRNLQVKAAQDRQALQGPITTRVQEVIDGIRAGLGCSLVFDVSNQGNSIASADKSLDLTPRVIEQLKGTPTPATQKPPASSPGIRGPGGTPPKTGGAKPPVGTGGGGGGGGGLLPAKF